MAPSRSDRPAFFFPPAALGFERARQRWPPFDRSDEGIGLLQKLNDIPGVDLPANAITKKPSETGTPLPDGL
jgi:hypothetical protein